MDIKSLLNPVDERVQGQTAFARQDRTQAQVETQSQIMATIQSRMPRSGLDAQALRRLSVPTRHLAADSYRKSAIGATNRDQDSPPNLAPAPLSASYPIKLLQGVHPYPSVSNHLLYQQPIRPTTPRLNGNLQRLTMHEILSELPFAESIKTQAVAELTQERKTRSDWQIWALRTDGTSKLAFKPAETWDQPWANYGTNHRPLETAYIYEEVSWVDRLPRVFWSTRMVEWVHKQAKDLKEIDNAPRPTYGRYYRTKDWAKYSDEVAVDIVFMTLLAGGLTKDKIPSRYLATCPTFEDGSNQIGLGSRFKG